MPPMWDELEVGSHEPEVSFTQPPCLGGSSQQRQPINQGLLLKALPLPCSDAFPIPGQPLISENSASCTPPRGAQPAPAATGQGGGAPRQSGWLWGRPGGREPIGFFSSFPFLSETNSQAVRRWHKSLIQPRPGLELCRVRRPAGACCSRERPLCGLRLARLRARCGPLLGSCVP